MIWKKNVINCEQILSYFHKKQEVKNILIFLIKEPAYVN